ncbi:ferrous iron transport protein A [Candidatus Woesearchaeota archaeon]|nr:ferrous iron transport protein A [Candidatus Woesearchaeota archaeon]
MVPLSNVKNGQRVRIKCIDCGFGLKRRLCSLGLYDGTMVEVVKNDSRGPVLLKVLNSKVVIGRGQAMKILVEEVR